MRLVSDSFSEQQPIPAEFAFAVIADPGPVALSSNQNPHLAWHDAPTGTLGFAIIMHDPDVPSVGNDVNQTGKTVTADLPRIDFNHWLLANLPASVTEIAAGSFSNTVTVGGKKALGLFDSAQGLNDYTGWFADDDAMRGDYYGYDGPCPPWNDTRIHRYIFTVFALSVAHLPLPKRFIRADLEAAMHGHILASATLTGRYTLNPALAY